MTYTNYFKIKNKEKHTFGYILCDMKKKSQLYVRVDEKEFRYFFKTFQVFYTFVKDVTKFSFISTFKVEILHSNLK